MKSNIFKKIFSCFLILILVLQNPISNKRLHTKAKIQTKTTNKIAPFLIASGLMMFSLLVNKCSTNQSSICNIDDNTLEKTLLKTDENITTRSKLITKIVEKRREFKDLRAFVLQQISLFIGVIPLNILKSHEDFIENYAYCYLDEKAKQIYNDLEHGSSTNDDKVLEKFKARISIIFNPVKKYKSNEKLINFFSFNDELMPHFVRNVFPEFTECRSAKLNEFLEKQDGPKRIEFNNALNLIKNPPKSVQKKIKKFMRRLNSENKTARKSTKNSTKKSTKKSTKNSNLVIDDNNLKETILEITKKVDAVNYFMAKANDASQTIIDANNNLNEIIKFIEKPLSTTFNKVVEKTGLGISISEKTAQEFLDKHWINKDKETFVKIKDMIIKSQKISEPHIKKIKELQEKYLPYVEKFNSAGLKAYNYLDNTSKLLKQIAAISTTDKPSIFIAKGLTISASVLNLIPVKTPQKQFIINGLNLTADTIQSSERLQTVIDNSIAASGRAIQNEAKLLEKSTEYGLLPRFAVINDDFAVDTDVNLANINIEPFKRVIRESFGDAAEEFERSAEKGDISRYARTFNDFGDGDLDSNLESYRYEDIKNEVKEVLNTFIENGKEYFRYNRDDSSSDSSSDNSSDNDNYWDNDNSSDRSSGGIIESIGNAAYDAVKETVANDEERHSNGEMSLAATTFGGFEKRRRIRKF